MPANRINRNLGANRVIPVCFILLCGLILAPGRPLRAQESVDQPSKPEPTAATTQQEIQRSTHQQTAMRLTRLSSLRSR